MIWVLIVVLWLMVLGTVIKFFTYGATADALNLAPGVRGGAYLGLAIRLVALIIATILLTQAYT